MDADLVCAIGSGEPLGSALDDLKAALAKLARRGQCGCVGRILQLAPLSIEGTQVDSQGYESQEDHQDHSQIDHAGASIFAQGGKQGSHLIYLRGLSTIITVVLRRGMVFKPNMLPRMVGMS